MSAFTPKALEADCIEPVFGPTRSSVLAMRGFRFANDDDGAKPKPKDPKPEESEDGENDDDDEKLSPAAKAKISKANREAANLRTRLHDLEEAEKKRADEKKDDLTKAQEANAELQSKLDTALVRVDRLEVAIDKKLTVKQANRLSGATREELEADADDFLTDLGGAADDKKTPPTKQPREALKGGGDPTASDDVEMSASEAADAVLAAQ
jgi:hypothetical protein